MRVHISLTALSADAVHAGITLSAARDVTEEPCEPWRVGAYVVSEREPRLIIYPNFLAPDEADYLSELARWGALEAAAAASMSGILVQSAQAVSWDGSRPARVAASGRTASIHLPRPCDDPAIQAIEERCAAATGIPTHPDEEPLGLRHTHPSTADECRERHCTALHLDTNQGGTYRCATVLLYVNDVAEGGETRFPLVGAAEPSELRDAARKIASLGVTAFSPSEAVESPPLALRRTLLDAAEADGVGLRLQPQRGLAAVFWTHTAEGLDPYSWHAGARLPPQVTEGKLLVQKFKALPRGCRPTARQGLGCALRLPAQFAPPPVV